MKKFLLFSLLCCLTWLNGAKLSAQGYSSTDLSSSYTYSTVYYIDLVDASNKSISEQFVASDGTIRNAIGAYVGEELRGAGHVEWVSEDNEGRYVFTVRVWTNDAAEVKFCVMDNNYLEYVIDTKDIAAAENTVGTPSNPITMTFVPVTEVSITPNTISVTVDGTANFSINYLPEGHSEFKNEPGFQCYASSDEEAIPFTVNSMSVTGVNVGKGSLNYAGYWNASATVNVSAKTIPVTDIENGESSLELEKWVDDEFTLNFSILPAGATNKNVTYTIGDEKVITLLPAVGHFKAAAKGSTTITVTTEDGNKTLTYTINVKQHVTNIDILNPNDAIHIPVGTNVTEYLNNNAANIYKVLPDDADNKSVTYTAIRADNVMTTAADGLITATGVGNCLVQIASNDVPNVTNTVSFSVYAVPASITVGTPNDYYYVDEVSRLTYSVLPQGSPQDVTVTSSDNSIVTPGTAANGAIPFTPKKKGTATLTITSKEYPTVKTTVTINVRVRITSIAFKNQKMTIVRDTKVPITADMFTIEPTDGDLDMSQLTFTTQENITNGLRGLLVVDENNSKSLIGLTPYTNYKLNVAAKTIQDSEISCTVDVQDKQTLASGWNWIGNGYDISTASNFYNGIGSSFVEARSKSALIYNDSKFGYFGDLNQLVAGEGYKVKTSANATVTNSANDSWLNGAFDVQIRAGWNWLANPFPRATTISQLIPNPTDGDIVKTLDGVATYNGNAWSQDLTIGEHEGIMYKASLATSFRWAPGNIVENTDYVQSILNGTAGARQVETAERIWNYDAHQFAGNMGIIAAGEELDDAHRYAVGAFVGDECRGQGTLRDGKWYVVAHLQGDEQVSLRLYDRQTETFHAMTIDGRESLDFAEMAGTFSRPLTLAAPSVTAIHSLTATGSEYPDAVITDLSGKTLQSGRIHIDELPKGMFILTVRTDKGLVSRKFVK